MRTETLWCRTTGYKHLQQNAWFYTPPPLPSPSSLPPFFSSLSLSLPAGDALTPTPALLPHRQLEVKHSRGQRGESVCGAGRTQASMPLAKEARAAG